MESKSSNSYTMRTVFVFFVFLLTLSFAHSKEGHSAGPELSITGIRIISFMRGVDLGKDNRSKAELLQYALLMEKSLLDGYKISHPNEYASLLDGRIRMIEGLLSSLPKDLQFSDVDLRDVISGKKVLNVSYVPFNVIAIRFENKDYYLERKETRGIERIVWASSDTSTELLQSTWERNFSFQGIKLTLLIGNAQN